MFSNYKPKTNKKGKRKKRVQIRFSRISRKVVSLLLRVHRIFSHIARLVDHHHLFVSLHIVGNCLGSWSRQGSKPDLDLGEVQVWEHDDNLFAEVLKPVPIVTPNFIEIELGSLVLLDGLLPHFFHVLMEGNHFQL